MNLDDYKNLYEIQSLDLKIKTHLDLIAEEEHRIVFVGKQANKRKESCEEAKLNLKKIKEESKKRESDLFSIQKELDRARGHLNDATTSHQLESLESEIAKLSPRALELETELFSLMEKEEEIIAQIKVDESYLSGVSDTLTEIEKEVNEIRISEKAKIDNLEERISALLENTDPELLRPFETVRKKHRFTHPLSTIQGSGCARCKYLVPSATKEQLERMFCIEICSGCGRLLTPLNARS